MAAAYAVKLPLLVILVYLLPFSSSDFTPNNTFFLACGSSSTVSLPPRSFKPDTPYLGPSNSNSLINPSGTSGLYNTARLFKTETSYQFTITNNPDTYILRLHFAPFSTQNTSLSTARFDVSALNRYLLLSNFSVAPSASPIIKEYLLWVDANLLILTFTPSTNSLAFISAIEVFNAPSDLVGPSIPTLVGLPGFGELPRQALETVYRINVGGPKVNSTDDSLWRTWTTDLAYFLSDSLAFHNATSSNINYQNYGNEIAPQIVYQTARTMAVTPILRLSNPNFNFNITWNFSVTPDYTYFIRMHFYDFVSPNPNDLYFDVYLGDLMAYPDLHLTDKSSDTSTSTASYTDFAVNPTGAGFLSVSIGRSSKSTPSTANAILNGLEIMKINNTGGSLSGGSFNPSGNNKKASPSLAVIIGSVLGILILIAAVIVASVLLCRRRRRHLQTQPSPKQKESTPRAWSPFAPFRDNSTSRSATSASVTTSSPRVGNLGLQISLIDIKLATNDFDGSFIIGSGGFGKVYKGVLKDGTRIAAKRSMAGSKQGYPEFHTEIIVLSGIRHRHLVSLIGYCDEQSEMILVYEYMEKGTLRSYLFGNPGLPCLTWQQRLNICIGAARGLHYLHTGHSHNIIHRDIKSTNILLDANYLAKVADFGLSRLGPDLEQTHVSTNVKGTFGYLDPEYFKTQKLTDKSDVYSFGVTLFEVLCGRRVIDQSVPREKVNLAEWALNCHRRGVLEKIVDPRIAGEINLNSLRKFGETAEKCLAEYGVDRPTIGDVLWNLEYALQLQETELRREPYEDSGSAVSNIQVEVVRQLPSTSIKSDEEEEEEKESGKESVILTSNVFSQLITDDGR